MTIYKFGGEILACKPIYLLTERCLDTVGPFCCTETGLGGGCLIGVLESNAHFLTLSLHPCISNELV